MVFGPQTEKNATVEIKVSPLARCPQLRKKKKKLPCPHKNKAALELNGGHRGHGLRYPCFFALVPLHSFPQTLNFPNGSVTAKLKWPCSLSKKKFKACKESGV